MVMVSGGGGNAWAKEMTIRRRIASMCAPHPEAIPLFSVRKGIFFSIKLLITIICMLGLDSTRRRNISLL